MKRLLLAVACCVATVAALAQPQINFNNKIGSAGIDFRVTDIESGAGVSGATFIAGLYWAHWEDGVLANLETGTPAVTTVFYADKESKYGYFAGGNVSLAGVDWGQTVYLAVAAWDKAYGTYAAAKNADIAGMSAKHGASVVTMLTMPGDPGSGAPPLPVNLTGLQAFTVQAVVIPEPSILALGLLGGVAFLLRRRS